MIRAAFGNNNVDTCARVCHSPTGYGLKSTPSAPRPGRRISIRSKTPTSIMVIGANPTDAHPVFASQMKRRLREGARLIVVDPRRIDLVKSAHIKADYHLPLLPGTNVAVINALAHVIVTEGLVNEQFVQERCDLEAFEQMAQLRRRRTELARSHGAVHRRPGRRSSRRGPAVCEGGQLRPSTTGSASPSTARDPPW